MAAPAAAERLLYTPEPSNKRHRPTMAAATWAAASVSVSVLTTTPQAGGGGGGGEDELLPGLPDHLAQLCLAPLPPRLVHAVCRPWRRLLYSPSFPAFLSLYAVLDDAASQGIGFAAYDAVSGRWDELPAPPMPSPPPRLWHPSFLSRRLPLQSVAAAGRLVLVAGSTHALRPALPRPVVFDPARRRWRAGPRFPFEPRRWCAAGAARGRVFVAGGVGAAYDAADARAGATWDPSSSEWEVLPPLRDGRFSRDAAEAVCSHARGKVCMVSLRARGAKEGAVFDLAGRRWEDMPLGMLAGWTGPSASADDSDTIFVVDEERGALVAYDWAADRWRTLVQTDRLKGAAESITAGGGRVCVAVDGGDRVLVIDVTSSCNATRMWEVAAPPGKRVVALHVLPRMTRAADTP